MCILYWQVWYSAQYAERMGASVFVNPELGKNQIVIVHSKNVEGFHMNIFLTNIPIYFDTKFSVSADAEYQSGSPSTSTDPKPVF